MNNNQFKRLPAKKIFLGTAILLTIFLLMSSTSVKNYTETQTASVKTLGSREYMETDSYSESPEPIMMAMATRDEAIQDEQVLFNDSSVQEQRIKKTGNLSLLIKNIEDSKLEIEKITKTQNGLIQNSNAGEYNSGEKYASITIKVPSENFESIIKEIKATALQVTNESTYATDITEEFLDTQTRLKVAQQEEQSYIKLLDQAKDVPEMLEVQRELSRVRTRIESLTGTIKYMESQTSMSTISISLKEDAIIKLPTKQFRLNSIVKEAFQGTMLILQNIGSFLIWLLMLLTIIAIPFSLIGYGAYRAYKKIRK